MTAVSREVNAAVAIAARDVVKSLKSVGSLVSSLAFPLIFVGLMGETIAQNMGAGLGYNYLQFMLIGMAVNTLFQVTIAGIMNLVEDRQNDFTQEMYVTPISRYAIIFGKILGSSCTSLFQLAGLILIALSGVLAWLAHIMPMTYVVDLTRAVYYWGEPQYHNVVLYSPALDMAVVIAYFCVFAVLGVWLFVRAETNR
ncbi:hypothetical protein [Alicyclobacillus kakegawensis]|uniref:hypothetical protein n=1 Tax=Alicyclobacillus kakegawensis TaxID=392012 RepID=UPI000835132C|nr:hypothetical protein [Alicyclobacillus kakegawensis]